MAKHSTAAAPFSGFPLALLRFLEELQANNNKKWFEANRERYESEVRQPALQFIAAMQRPLAKLSPHFTAVPKKVGGSLMRLHRDVRFSKDKSPYKTNVGIQFRHELGKDVHAPGFYFHIDTDEVFLAAGLWRPESTALTAIRQAIDDDPSAWRRASRGKRFCDHFDLAGESLRRPPRGYEAHHPQIEDLKRKDHIAVAQLDHDVLSNPKLVQLVTQAFTTAKPYMQFLCAAIEVPF